MPIPMTTGPEPAPQWLGTAGAAEPTKVCALAELVHAGATTLQQHMDTHTDQSYEDVVAVVLRAMYDLGAITWTEAGQ